MADYAKAVSDWCGAYMREDHDALRDAFRRMAAFPIVDDADRRAQYLMGVLDKVAEKTREEVEKELKEQGR